MISDNQVGSGFSGAVGYTTSKAEAEEESWTAWVKQQAGIEQKVDAIQTRNILMDGDPQMAAEEMRVTANQNKRVEKPRYSVSLSYHPDDDPSDAEMIRDMDDFLERRGLAEHQAILAIHRDRDHAHIHATVNRVHPETGELWRDDFDYLKSMSVVRAIEQERGWTQPKRDDSRGRVADWKIQRFKRTGEIPFGQEVAAQAGDAFAESKTWEELQRKLADKGLQVVRKGSGGVVTDGEEEAPLSEVARKWSFNRLDNKFPDQFQKNERTQGQNRPRSSEKKGAKKRAGRDQEGGQQPQRGGRKGKEGNDRDQRGDDRGGRGTESDAENRRETRHNARGLAGRSDDRKEGSKDVRQEGQSSAEDRERRRRGRRSRESDQRSGNEAARETPNRELDLPDYDDLSALDWRSAEALGGPDEIEEVKHIDDEGMITIPEKLTDQGQIVSRELAQGNKIEAAKAWEKMKEKKQNHDWKKLSKNDKIRLKEAIETLENRKNQKNQSQSQDRDRGNDQDKGQGRNKGGRGQGR